MKTIAVPALITLRDVFTQAPGQSISFHAWACMGWFNDPRWITPQINSPKFDKVFDAFAKAEPGAEILLEDADYDLLRQIVLEPQGPQQPPLIVRQMKAYRDAVLAAQDANTSGGKDPKTSARAMG